MNKIILLLITPLILFSQIEHNMLLERQMLIQKYDWNKTHTRNVADMLTEGAFLDTSNFLRMGVQLDAFIQNAPIDPSWNYKEKFNMMGAPVFSGRGTRHLTFYMSGMFQNAKTDIVDNNKRYLGETLMGFWGDFEISKIVYENEHFYFKYGRDYFLPGMYFYESLLFSRYQYPYDQIHAAYRNKIIEVSSYYLRLNDMLYSGERYLRHLNGHRVSFNILDKGYLALNEIILYTGVQRPLNPALFNPLMIYYIYQRNENVSQTASLLSMDFFYDFKVLFIHGEIIVDDIMKDRKIYSDLEPHKLGINLTAGVKGIVPGLHFNLNYTAISNRVYATGNGDGFTEYLVHENLPIGHYMGSNLWEIKSSLSYIKAKYQGELQFIYRQYGDDVVFSPYNRDHYQGHAWDDPLEPDAEWNEPFPYVSGGGEPSVFWGIKLDNYYQIIDHLGVNFKASYWIEKGLLPSHFNISGGVYFNF